MSKRGDKKQIKKNRYFNYYLVGSKFLTNVFLRSYNSFLEWTLSMRVTVEDVVVRPFMFLGYYLPIYWVSMPWRLMNMYGALNYIDRKALKGAVLLYSWFWNIVNRLYRSVAD